MRSQCDTAALPRFMKFLLQVQPLLLPPQPVQRLLLMRASWLPKSPITPASLLEDVFVGIPRLFFFIRKIRACVQILKETKNRLELGEKKEVTTTANMFLGLRRTKKNHCILRVGLLKAFTILIARVQNNAKQLTDSKLHQKKY